MKVLKVLYDENLSPHLVEVLRDLYTDGVHVRDIGLASADDSEVWSFAAANGLIIITKDADFNQRAFLLGPPPKVVWIRSGNASTNDIAQLLRRHHSDVLLLERDPEGVLLTIK